MSSGIYFIRNVKNGKLYVGSAKSFYLRWNNHRSRLRKNKHHNKHLQHAWNKYGESSFEFEVAEFVPVEELDAVESVYLELAKRIPYMYYNHRYDPTGRDTKHSEETRKLISQKTKEAMAKLPKRIYTPEIRAKISLGRRGKGGKFGKDNPNYGKGYKIKGNKFWMLVKNRRGYDKSGKNNPRYDHTIYHFIDKQGNTESMTTFELGKKYNMNTQSIRDLVKGKIKTCFGWRLNKEINN